jgi:cell division protease FtsH
MLEGSGPLNFRKNLAVWVVIAVLLYMLFSLFQGAQTRGPHQQVAFSDFLTEVEAGSIRNVTIQGNKVTGHYDDGRAFRTYSPNDPNLIPTLTRKGVHITAVPPEDEVPSLFGILISWFPMLLLIGIWIFFMRQMQSGGGKAMGFGKSRARMLTEKSGRVTSRTSPASTKPSRNSRKSSNS